MAYEKQNWIDGESPLNAERMNHMEDGIGQLSNEKIDKDQGLENAQKILYVNDDGNASFLESGDGLAVKKIAGKNIVFGEWLPLRYEADGSLTLYEGIADKYLSNTGFKDKFPVKPSTTYTVSCTELMSDVTAVSAYLRQYDENGEFIVGSGLNSFWNASAALSKSFTTDARAAYITFYVYGQGAADGWRGYIIPNLMIEEGSTATSYEPYTSTDLLGLDTSEVYDMMAEKGLMPKRLTVPGYYFSGNYIENKCARIRELLDGCAGNGDGFFFITDQHWELNARNSPALMNYISKQVHIPRVFSGGDTADSMQEQYADVLSAAFGGDIHHCSGNHDWFGAMDGNKLAYIWDMGKREQIGNAKRHYYYVDNPQQSIRYIVLCSYSNETGSIASAYDTEQIEWLRDVALKVDDGWTVLVVTHSLYYGFGETASFVPSPDGAASVIEVLDAATCDVACVVTGHAHLDRVCHTPGGIPVVVVTCDKYSPWIDNSTNMEPWLADRVEGTITEQAFDVVALDKAARKLTFVRIGAPADNWTDGVSTGKVEERVVTY